MIAGSATSLLKRRNPMERNIKAIRGLIWIYFLLLIFEGSLRMLLPSLSNILLVVRDPFLLLAYVIAQVSRVFPWNRFVFLLWLLGGVSMAIGYSLLPSNPMVVLYGFRCAYLHVPLVFLMPLVMNEDHVAEIGKWFLILSIPIAILMTIQFAAGPDSWLNRGIDMQFKQIGAGEGKIRPPGTFTAISGPATYFAFVIAFILYDQFRKGRYSPWLVFLASSATCLGVTVSISRTALANVAMVILTSAIGVALARPQQSVKFVRFAILTSIAFFVVGQLPIFDESVDVFSKRVTGASNTEGGTSGISHRALRSFTDAIDISTVTPLEGNGLGTGTNAGMVMYRGATGGGTEYEWARVIYEMGPPIGFIYLAMRVGLGIFVLVIGYRAAKKGSMLSMILAGTCWLFVITGTLQQTTILGFTMLGAGLCLAAARPTPSLPGFVGPQVGGATTATRAFA